MKFMGITFALLVILLRSNEGLKTKFCAPRRVSKISYYNRGSIGSCKRSETVVKAFPDPTILPTFQQALLLNGIQASILLAINQKFLTKSGLIHATALGIGLWTFLGPTGWAVCVSYLILGNIVTKVKMLEKEKLGIAEKRGGARGPENVWGSAATAMICAILTYLLPQYAIPLKAGYVGSLATKLSDTFASEIGKAYGKTTYLITTFERVPRGTEGAVSLEGTLAGVFGSLLLTMIGYYTGMITTIPAILICVFAAFIATTAESYIGAIFQDDILWLTNELVNLINTVIGAAIAIGLVAIVS